MVPAVSSRISPVPPYSGYPPWLQSCVYGAVTRYGRAFQARSTCIADNCAGPTTPQGMPWGLGFSAFARHYLRNHYCFLFLRVLRCFSSPGFSPCGFQAFSLEGFPIRTPADQGSFAPPRSFSQLTTSFVISGSQGIPHTPLICFLFFDAFRLGISWRFRATSARALALLLSFFLSRRVNELFAGVRRSAAAMYT